MRAGIDLNRYAKVLLVNDLYVNGLVMLVEKWVTYLLGWLVLVEEDGGVVSLDVDG